VKKENPVRKKNDKWAFLLYIAGKTQRTAATVSNLKIICEDRLKDNYQIEVIDLLKNPQLARSEQIVALPTLVRKSPLPKRSIIGDLSNTDRVLIGLGLL
jgi:circadian clock protein KaiB